MNLAKISAKGEIVINNASAQAIYKGQSAFKGVAETMGVYNDEDVQALVNEVRYGKENNLILPSGAAE